MPPRWNVSRLNSHGTHTSSHSSRRGSHARGTLSVSNIVRAMSGPSACSGWPGPGMRWWTSAKAPPGVRPRAASTASWCAEGSRTRSFVKRMSRAAAGRPARSSAIR